MIKIEAFHDDKILTSILLLIPLLLSCVAVQTAKLDQGSHNDDVITLKQRMYELGYFKSDKEESYSQRNL